jgi:hypothetical protein
MADVQVNLGAALFRPGRPSTILAVISSDKILLTELDIPFCDQLPP